MKTSIGIALLAIANLRADTITNLTALERTVVTNQVRRVRNEAFFNRTNRVQRLTNATPMRPWAWTFVTNRVTLRMLTFQWAGKTRTVTEEVKP